MLTHHDIELARRYRNRRISEFSFHPMAKKWGGLGASSDLDATPQVTAQVTEFCLVPRSAKEIMAELGLKHWKNFQSNYLLPLIEMGMLTRTIPDKPNSRLQKYRLTEKRPKAAQIPRGDR